MLGQIEPVLNSEAVANISDKLQRYIFKLDAGEPLANLTTIAILLIALFALAWLGHFLTIKVLFRGLEKLVQKTAARWDDALLSHGFFDRLAHLVPGAIVHSLAEPLFGQGSTTWRLLINGSRIYLVLAGAFAFDAFLSAGLTIYKRFEVSRRVPIKGFIQIVKIFTYSLSGIFILAIILSDEPATIFAGMGAMTAVIILVFKDAILGFVAGIQLTANDMVRIGDWIEVSRFGADGDVTDITLTTVKVQNWDKTIVTVPAYALISDSFRNWRGMSESGGRRMKRNIYIDMATIKFCTPEMIARFKKFDYIRDYIEIRQTEIDAYNAENKIDNSVLVNGRRMTNIGIFRAYVSAYLKNHPMVNQDMIMMVRQLEPSSKGLPVQIYAFCADKRWVLYEGVQSDIFDHILSVVNQFDLRMFQEPSGADLNSDFIIRQASSQ